MSLAKRSQAPGRDHGLFIAASVVGAICIASAGTLLIMAFGLV
jgi:hypothetical protein